MPDQIRHDYQNKGLEMVFGFFKPATSNE